MTTENGVTAGVQAQQQQSEAIEPIDLERNYHAIGIPAVNAVNIFKHKGPKATPHVGQIFEFED